MYSIRRRLLSMQLKKLEHTYSVNTNGTNMLTKKTGE